MMIYRCTINALVTGIMLIIVMNRKTGREQAWLSFDLANVIHE